MTTRLQLRTSLRTRLEDASAAPLWTDADLNEALTEAVRAYGNRFPAEKTANLAIVAGTGVYAQPADARSGGILSVFDVDGAQIPPRTADPRGKGPADSNAEQSWSQFAGTIRFERNPATTETWSLFYLAHRELVADDVTAQPIEQSHETIVLALAAAEAWERRAAADTKRGVDKSVATRQRQHAVAESERLIAAARRRVRAGLL